MRLGIIPRDEKFFDLFVVQSDLICQAADLLWELVHHYDQRDDIVAKINVVEHQGDDMIHDIAVRLNKTFVTPIDREDIHELANFLDDVLDYIQGSATRMQLFDVTQPTEDCIALVDVIMRGAAIIRKGIAQLPTFKDISLLRKEIKILEREGDAINRKAIAGLFHDGTAVLDVIKWKEIYESLETCTDKCEDVFDVLEGVVLKHA